MTRCVAVLNTPERAKGEIPRCEKEGWFTVTTYQKNKEGKLTFFNRDNFCDEHVYEFAMYYMNYLGLIVEVVSAEIEPEKVHFT